MSHTSRSDFPEVLPTVKTQYCWKCQASGAERKDDKGKVEYWCKVCGTASPRVLIHDPKMVAWFNDSGYLVHESCGVFLYRSDGKILLFKRTKFPYLLTIPAGHLEHGEDPDICAARETYEEVGVQPKSIHKIFEGTIDGDSCLGGADIHKWHAYGADINQADQSAIKLDEEGSAWGWYAPETLNESNTVQPVLYLLKHAHYENHQATKDK